MTRRADDKEPFPNWNVPATKGDVLMAMIYARGLSLSLFKMIQALEPADRAKMIEASNEYSANWETLNKAIEVVAGRRDWVSDE